MADLNRLYIVWDTLDWLLIRREQGDLEACEALMGSLRRLVGPERFCRGEMPSPWVK